MKLREKQPEVVPVMVGTAGHVDHGKTELVRNLTGCETDTLPEEKARSLSIDLGFAPCALPGDRVAGLVDVPGHEDFIRNMVAGAASIDVLLLVVAADDGVMQQTIEHLKIVKLLRTPQVFAVITKIDLVDAARLARVRRDLRELLARAGWPDAPVLTASNVTFEGLGAGPEQRRAAIALVRRGPDERGFRMNIARVFSAEGHGTIVTGVPISGAARIGDELELLPAGRGTTVRALQSYKHEAEQVPAGSCAALALRRIKVAEVRRGMTVAAPGVYRATTTLLAGVENVSGALTLKKRSEMRFHSGTAMVMARVRLLDGEELKPGSAGLLRLELAEPVVLAAGDRFIIRSLSPVTTLGGGLVLTAEAGEVRRNEPGLLERLRAALRAAREGDFFGSELLAGPDAVRREADLLRLTQLPPSAAAALLTAKEQRGELIRLGTGGWLVRSRLDEVRALVRKTLTREHAAHRRAWGMEAKQVCALFNLEAGSFGRLAEELSAGGEIAVRHGRLALADWRPALEERLLGLREALLVRIRAAGVNAPARGDLQRELNAGEADLRLVLRLLVEEGEIAVLGSNLVPRSLVEEWREALLALFAERAIVDLPAFRRATGLSRNLAVAVLEHFDGAGLTRRVAEGRVLARAEAAGRLREGAQGG